MKPFIQKSALNSTIANWMQMVDKNNLSSFGLFAYVTDSGVAQLINHIGNHLKNSPRVRWVFGFDYGRSQPSAIRKLASIGNTEIRIYDGHHVASAIGFVPRNTYHLKTVFTHRNNGTPVNQIIGSGNLSSSGLLSGIEAGCVINYDMVNKKDGQTCVADLEEIWQTSIPYEAVIDDYENRYSKLTISANIIQPNKAKTERIFWIDVGYVTKNRGTNLPGNQFDLPRGSHVNLGLKKVTNPELNSILGDLMIETPTGDIISRRIRFGNNSMEKLTLPIPENFGYECYDGKILTFKVTNGKVLLNAFEQDDFQKVYGMYISSLKQMQSGRACGTIDIPKK